MGWLPPRADLPPHLEAIRQQIANLPPDEWKALYGRLTSDKMRANDERHAMYAVEAERQRKGSR